MGLAGLYWKDFEGALLDRLRELHGKGGYIFAEGSLPQPFEEFIKPSR